MQTVNYDTQSYWYEVIQLSLLQYLIGLKESSDTKASFDDYLIAIRFLLCAVFPFLGSRCLSTSPLLP